MYGRPTSCSGTWDGYQQQSSLRSRRKALRLSLVKLLIINSYLHCGVQAGAALSVANISRRRALLYEILWFESFILLVGKYEPVIRNTTLVRLRMPNAAWLIC